LPGSDRPVHRHGLGAAFGYAFAGLRAAWRGEPNLRLHALAALAVAAAAAALRLPPWAWALLALACAGVIAAELLNAAVEAVVDLVSPAEHPLAKRAKDVAAAGVLVAALGAVGVAAALAVWWLGAR
jgi:diacylglycerol kinase